MLNPFFIQATPVYIEMRVALTFVKSN